MSIVFYCHVRRLTGGMAYVGYHDVIGITHGARYTSRRLPLKLVYCEEFGRIDHVFLREKQIQRWGKEKKKALIERNFEVLILMSKKSFRKRNVEKKNVRSSSSPQIIK